jgi:MoaA/NifB/PqqE/SkfB family radical SAM enzyme
MSPQIQKQRLPLDLVKNVLEDCARMGTTNIYLAGGGEPFMHPNIMEIIRHIKSLGLACHINTNFTLVNRHQASEFVELGVDHLIISLWAATPETYRRTHPNKSETMFHQLMDRVRYIIDLRRHGSPHITFYNVIMNPNCHEIEAMVFLAAELDIDAVEFTVVDVIPDRTDSLLLDEQQRSEVLKAYQRIQNRMKNSRADGKLEIKIEDFIKRISCSGAEQGDYDMEMVPAIPCLIGWNFSRILADGNVNACLKAHRMPVGNIYRNSFEEIWNSPEQKHFRRMTKKGKINDPFFSMIGNNENAKVGCFRGCDDLERNRRLWHRLQDQTAPQKLILRGMGYLLRTKTFFTNRN